MAAIDGLVGKVFTLDAVSFPGTASVDINQIESENISSNLSHAFIAGGGDLFNEAVFLHGVAPVISFTTTQVAAVLDILSATSTFPLFTRAITSSDSCVFKLRQRDVGAGLKSGSNHVSLTITSALMVARPIQASQGEAATLQVELHLYSTDGTTAPWTISTSAAAATQAYTASMHTVGPISISSTDYGDIQSLTIDPGITLTKVAGGGSLYPTFVAVQSVEPVITANVLDMTLLSSPGLAGAALPGDVSIWLRHKAVDGAGNVANATATHIMFSVYKGVYFFDGISLGSRDNASGTLTIRPVVKDDTTDVHFDVDTTAAIS